MTGIVQVDNQIFRTRQRRIRDKCLETIPEDRAIEFKASTKAKESFKKIAIGKEENLEVNIKGRSYKLSIAPRKQRKEAKHGYSQQYWDTVDKALRYRQLNKGK